MTSFIVVNATDSQLTDVNAGGVDVPKQSIRDTITLTNAEAFALVQIAGVTVMKDVSSASYKERRAIARVLKHSKSSAGNTSGT